MGTLDQITTVLFEANIIDDLEGQLIFKVKQQGHGYLPGSILVGDEPTEFFIPIQSPNINTHIKSLICTISKLKEMVGAGDIVHRDFHIKSLICTISKLTEIVGSGD